MPVMRPLQDLPQTSICWDCFKDSGCVARPSKSFPLCCLQHPEKWPPMTSLEMKKTPLRSGEEGLSGPFQDCCFPAKLPCVYWTQEGCGEGWSSRYHLEGEYSGAKGCFLWSMASLRNLDNFPSVLPNPFLPPLEISSKTHPPPLWRKLT